MKYFFTILLFLLIRVAYASSDLEDALSKLTYARYCADSLQESRRAINSYNEVLSMLEESDLDSLRLVVETERIDLLLKIGERTELLPSLTKAIDLAQKHENYNELSRLLSLKGFLYIQLGFKIQAQSALDKAHESAMKIQNKDIRNGRLAYHAAVSAQAADHSEEKIRQLNESYHYFMKVSKGHPEYRSAQISGNSFYASAFMEKEQLDSALHYMMLASSYLDPEHALQDDYYAIINFAKLYYIKEDYSHAKEWLLRALQQAEAQNNTYRQGIIYYHLYNTEFLLGETQQANQYLQKYASLKAELDKNQKISISLIETQLSTMRDQAIARGPQNQTNLIILSSIILGAAALWFFKRNRTPSPKAASSNEPTKELHPTQIKELSDLVKSNDSSFIIKFHEYYPTFANTLNGQATSRLNNSEIEICACTKLNFSTKDIALYRHHTLRSVENRKYRIRKKLSLAPDVDFLVWIASIR